MATDFIYMLRLLIESNDPLPLMGWATLYFLTLYLCFSNAAQVLTRMVRRPIAAAMLSTQQYTRELACSAQTIAVFGIGMLVPWGMVKLGLAGIAYDTPAIRIASELLILVIFNDLHFYVTHRLLHARFKQFHIAHHRSTVATPYAAYSMSAVEAVLLGSVMPVAMLIHDFSVESLMLLPVWSIAINTLAHSNCDFFYWAKAGSILQFIRRHQTHHSRYHGNFGFFFPQLDRWFGTESSPASPPQFPTLGDHT